MSDTSEQEIPYVELCSIRVDAAADQGYTLLLAEPKPEVGEGHSLLWADPAEER